jgi:hypothetical protein
VRWAQTREIDHAKADHDYSVAGRPDRHFSCDGWFAKSISTPPSTNPDKQLLPEAPVGHRQPRADQVPSEKNLMDDPNDPINRENAVLDRMVKGICRGC